MVPGFAERERRAADMQRRDWLSGTPYGMQNRSLQQYASPRLRNPKLGLLRRSLVSAAALGNRLLARRPRTMQPIPES
jgi:hypothetical protein